MQELDPWDLTSCNHLPARERKSKKIKQNKNQIEVNDYDLEREDPPPAKSTNILQCKLKLTCWPPSFSK